MENNIIFCNSFDFNTFRFLNYKYTDKAAGVEINYFAYMTEGTAKICTEDETVYIKEGDLFFIPNGCKYRSYWYGSPKIEFISLAFRFMPNFDNKYYPVQVIQYDAHAARMMQDIAARETLDAAVIGEFYSMVGLLMPTMTFRCKGHMAETVDKVKRLIVGDPHLTTKELAKKCALSESALYSLFKKHSDRSINDIKRAVIIEKAKDLLISTDRPVEELSRMLGFSSSAYFRKCFKEHFGISPREMRKHSGI